MSRLFKVIALALLILLAAGALFAQDAPMSRPAWPAYALTYLLGFGSGNFYLGQNGFGFLIGDAAGIAGLGIGYAVIVSSVLAIGTGSTTSSLTSAGTGVITGYGLVVVGSIVYLVSRVWEDIAIFGAVDKARKAGTVAEVEPILEMNNNSLEAGISIRYE